MCEKKNKKTTVEKAKEELSRSKKKLDKSLCEGEDKLCEFIAHLWGKKENIISSKSK